MKSNKIKKRLKFLAKKIMIITKIIFFVWSQEHKSNNKTLIKRTLMKRNTMKTETFVKNTMIKRNTRTQIKRTSEYLLTIFLSIITLLKVLLTKKKQTKITYLSNFSSVLSNSLFATSFSSFALITWCWALSNLSFKISTSVARSSRSICNHKSVCQ